MTPAQTAMLAAAHYGTGKSKRAGPPPATGGGADLMRFASMSTG